MRPPEQKSRGTTVAVALVLLGWFAICCGCGGFITAAVIEAEQDDSEYYDAIPTDTGF